MKKDTKLMNYKNIISNTQNQIINSSKTQIVNYHNKLDNKNAKVKNKLMIFSSPDKENQANTANKVPNFLSPLNQEHIANNYDFNSPNKTIQIQSIQQLRSHKGKDTYSQNINKSILYQGISKDGKFKVQSKYLQGQQLSKASQQQKRQNNLIILKYAKQINFSSLPYIQPAKKSNKQNDIIKAFAVNTHQGIVRNYNQDRVSVTLNIKKQGTKAHFFAVFDGHGGNGCCDFLKQHFHEYLTKSSNFPQDPRKSLIQAVELSQRHFLQKAKINKDSSGSCALVVLILNDLVYILNVGDSRAILSAENGSYAYNLSRDHRPTDIKQQLRIINAGGKIYRTQMIPIQKVSSSKQNVSLGPLRVIPGRLSVTRTFGDIQAKNQQFGGIYGVISAQPQIKKFKLSGEEDFLLIVCDGVVERMQSSEVVETAWKIMKNKGNIHEKAGLAVDSILTECMRRKSSDNLTSIMICFKNEQKLQEIKRKQK